MKTKLKIIIPLIIALAVVFIAFFTIRFTPADTPDITSLMETAQKYLIENNYEQAIYEFNGIINLDPKNVEAYLGLAEAYDKNGQRDMAITVLEKGYKLTEDERIKTQLDIMSDSAEYTNEAVTAAEDEDIAAETSVSMTETSPEAEPETIILSVEDEAEEIRAQALEIINMFDYEPKTGEPNSVVYYMQQQDGNTDREDYWCGIASRCEYDSEGNIAESRYGLYSFYDSDMKNHLQNYPYVNNYVENYHKRYYINEYTTTYGSTYSYHGITGLSWSEYTEKNDEYFLFMDPLNEGFLTKIFITDGNIESIEEITTFNKTVYSFKDGEWTVAYSSTGGYNAVYHPCTAGLPDGITDADFFKNDSD